MIETAVGSVGARGLDSRPRLSVIVGDAFDAIPRLSPNSIDLVLTSPPYWGHRTYDQQHNWDILKEWIAAGGSAHQHPGYNWYRKHGGILGLEPLPEWYAANLSEILDLAKGCLKPGGSMWINVGDTYFARWSSIRDAGRQGLGGGTRQRRKTPMGGFRQEKQLLLVPARFAIAMQDRRWILRNDLIWSKPNAVPRPEADRLKLAHEHFFHFVKRPVTGRAKYYYDRTKVERGGADVVSCAVRPGEKGHTATFPEELIRPRILSSCPPKGELLDPFCGTGRALAVALETGRSATGFDVSPTYVAMARELIRQRRVS